MNKLAKLALGAVMAGGIAVSAVPPAQAGVSVGIGIGVPGPGYGPGWEHRRWCYYHPRQCGGPGYVGGPGIAVGVPGIGVYVGGRGYWDGHRYWGHRYWGHGGWRYR